MKTNMKKYRVKEEYLTITKYVKGWKKVEKPFAWFLTVGIPFLISLLKGNNKGNR